MIHCVKIICFIHRILFFKSDNKARRDFKNGISKSWKIAILAYLELQSRFPTANANQNNFEIKKISEWETTVFFLKKLQKFCLWSKIRPQPQQQTQFGVRIFHIFIVSWCRSACTSIINFKIFINSKSKNVVNDQVNPKKNLTCAHFCVRNDTWKYEKSLFFMILRFLFWSFWMFSARKCARPHDFFKKDSADDLDEFCTRF